MTTRKIAVLHGVNLNCLGNRDPQHYGTLTLQTLEEKIRAFAGEYGFAVQCRQTNSEQEYVEWLQASAEDVHGLVLNPGAWTHYAWSIRDALEIAGIPAIEVHLSDITRREKFRQVSVIADLCKQTIAGQGPDGYRIAFSALNDCISQEGVE